MKKAACTAAASAGDGMTGGWQAAEDMTITEERKELPRTAEQAVLFGLGEPSLHEKTAP